jgi:urease accessory protein
MNKMHLWQLISPTLPIGAYAYSQGFESAVEFNWVNNEEQALKWISGILTRVLGELDAPIFLRLSCAWKDQDEKSLAYWNNFLLASRESSELLAEDQQIAKALYRLIKDLKIISPSKLKLLARIEHPSYCLVFSLITLSSEIDTHTGLSGFLWAWCENQVAAAIKLIPLGQTSGQRILLALTPLIERVVNKAKLIEDEDIGSIAPGYSILSAKHETQYSRLFRS